MHLHRFRNRSALLVALVATFIIACGDDEEAPGLPATAAPTDSLGIGAGGSSPGGDSDAHGPGSVDPGRSGDPSPGPGPDATPPDPAGTGGSAEPGQTASGPAPSPSSAVDWDALYGTWEDPDTGLIWQNPSTEERMNWLSSRNFCNDLVLDGHDDWRLPDVDEMRSLIRGCSATEFSLDQEDADLDVPGVCRVRNGSGRNWADASGDPEVLPCNACRRDEPPPTGSPCHWPDDLDGACTGYYTSIEAGERAVQGIPTRLTVVVDFLQGVVREGYIGTTSGSFTRLPVRCVRGTVPAPIQVVEWDTDPFYNPVLQRYQLTLSGGLWQRYESFARPEADCSTLTGRTGLMRQYELRNATPEDRAFRISNRWPPDATGAIHAYSAPVDVDAPLAGCLSGSENRGILDPNFGEVELDDVMVPAGGSVWIVVSSHRQSETGAFQLEINSRVTSENLEPPEEASPGDEAVISLGSGYACAVLDEEIVCWGTNSAGQQNAPDGPFTQVASASTHTCGLRPGGSVVCWGEDGVGRLTPPAGTSFLQISAGSHHTCGVRADRTLVCWGYPPFRELVEPPEGTFLQISVGGNEGCGIRTDGTIDCWRYAVLPTSADASLWEPPTSRYKQISAGADHNCAVHVSGRVDCWGNDRYGATEAPAGTFVQVSAGGRHSCGIRPGGALECWGERPADGYDGYHVLRFPEATWSQVALGSNYGCGLTVDDEILCWGEDWLGQASPP